MLPPGHFAGGYLAALGLLTWSGIQIPDEQKPVILLVGSLIGFAPDLDMFRAFRNSKNFIVTPGENHRAFSTHAPFLWLIAGIVLAIFAPNPFWKMTGLLVWVAAWSHFFLDSIQYGIMWFWPFSKRLYSFRDTCLEFTIYDTTFIGYWKTFLGEYVRLFRISFLCECVLTGSAIVLFIWRM